MKSNSSIDYHAPSVDVIILLPEGMLCDSGTATTDKFTVDNELDW